MDYQYIHQGPKVHNRSSPRNSDAREELKVSNAGGERIFHRQDCTPSADVALLLSLFAQQVQFDSFSGTSCTSLGNDTGSNRDCEGPPFFLGLPLPLFGSSSTDERSKGDGSVGTATFKTGEAGWCYPISSGFVGTSGSCGSCGAGWSKALESGKPPCTVLRTATGNLGSTI